MHRQMESDHTCITKIQTTELKKQQPKKEGILWGAISSVKQGKQKLAPNKKQPAAAPPSENQLT